MISRLFLGLLFFFVWSLQAQEDFIHYTPEHGLPSSEVYDVICDQKGFIWISTDRGVSRFNGYTFENFYTSDGLTDNLIIELFEDKHNRIWFSANSGQLCYYDYTDAKIHEYQYNDKLQKYLPSRVIIKSIRVDSSGTLYIGYLSFGSISLDKDGKITVIDSRPAKQSTIYKACFREVEGQPLLYTVGANNHFNDTVEIQVDLPGIRLYRTLPLASGHFLDAYMKKRKNGTYVCSVPGFLLEFAPGKQPLIIPIKDDVRRIYEDSRQRLWICFRKEGARLYEPGEHLGSKRFSTILPEKYTNAICEDKEQGMWVGIYNDALYYRPGVNINVEKVPGIPAAAVLKCMGSKDSDLYIGTESGQLYCFHANGTLDSRMLPVSHITWIQDLDSGLMVYGNRRCYIWKNKVRVLSKPERSEGVYSVRKTDSVIYAGAYSSMLRFMARPPYTELPFVRLFPGRFEAIFADKGRLLLGSSNGVYSFEDDTTLSYNHWFDKACRTVDIQSIRGYLAFATLGEGIRFVNRDNGKAFTLGTRQGMLSNNINALYTNDSSLWAASNFGLNEIRFSRDSFRVYSYTISNGLKVSEIRKIQIHNNRLWMMTPRGIYSFGLAGIINNREGIPVHILSVINGDTAYTGTSLLGDIRVHFNSILRIRYVGLSYKQYRNIQYKYRLLEKDSAWAYTRNTEVEFAFLSEGHYTFELSASNEDGEWSAAVKFHFSIEPPFWKTWWFMLTSGLLVFGIFLTLFMVRIRRLKEENRIREQLYDYRQQALVARMNPHFIFNSLNSIHYFIFNEDKRMAGKYLTRFASLMRLTLDLSTREYVKLEEDIRALELYMELEAWRFKDKFGFTLHIDKTLDLSQTLVPPMLVQPFVENAVKHGLLNRSGAGGQLDVYYRRAGQNLECIVEDNGVGREEVERLKQQHIPGPAHRSAGINLTLQRLETACTKNKQPFLFIYTDKTPATHSETGTIIRFYIPFNYAKNTDH